MHYRNFSYYYYYYCYYYYYYHHHHTLLFGVKEYVRLKSSS